MTRVWALSLVSRTKVLAAAEMERKKGFPHTELYEKCVVGLGVE
jgi:hypothetical protein